jgi:hypothetical protein
VSCDGFRLEQLLITASSVLAASTYESDRALALELRARAVRLQQFRRYAENDLRRGFILPIAWVNRIDGIPTPEADALEGRQPLEDQRT